MSISAVPVPGRPLFEHSVQFYSAEALFIDDLCKFLKGVLCAGCPAIAIATHAHSRTILRTLQAAEVNLSEAIGQGRYQPLDAPEVLPQFL